MVIIKVAWHVFKMKEIKYVSTTDPKVHEARTSLATYIISLTGMEFLGKRSGPNNYNEAPEIYPYVPNIF